jgi:hypothetical protein
MIKPRVVELVELELLDEVGDRLEQLGAGLFGKPRRCVYDRNATMPG